MYLLTNKDNILGGFTPLGICNIIQSEIDGARMDNWVDLKDETQLTYLNGTMRYSISLDHLRSLSFEDRLLYLLTEYSKNRIEDLNTIKRQLILELGRHSIGGNIKYNQSKKLVEKAFEMIKPKL